MNRPTFAQLVAASLVLTVNASAQPWVVEDHYIAILQSDRSVAVVKVAQEILARCGSSITKRLYELISWENVGAEVNFEEAARMALRGSPNTSVTLAKARLHDATVSRAFEVLAMIGAPSFEVLVKALNDGKSRYRELVLETFIAIGDKSAVVPLRDFADKHPPERDRVLQAVAKLEGGDGVEVTSWQPRAAIGSIEFEFVRIAPGEFLMGSREGADRSEMPAHRVTLTRGFELGKYEVTQAQWAEVMGNNPAYFTACGPSCPVEQVSWKDVQQFLARLNARGDGYTYRLPTDAEWEYAARAGTSGLYTKNLHEMAWYRANSAGRPHPVGTKRPNGWGLYDMHGNVQEWVADWYGEYGSTSREPDPSGPPSGDRRVVRGGSWDAAAWDCHSASRERATPDRPNLPWHKIGFRVVRVQSS